MSATKTTSSSFPFLSILCLIFITLKLTGYITWSWWWVLSPLWLPIIVVLGATVVIGGLYLLLKKLFGK